MKNPPQFRDCLDDRVFGYDAAGPKVFLEFGTADHTTRPLGEVNQNLHGLRLQPDLASADCHTKAGGIDVISGDLKCVHFGQRQFCQGFHLCSQLADNARIFGES
jgi:hypothetical protein